VGVLRNEKKKLFFSAPYVHMRNGADECALSLHSSAPFLIFICAISHIHLRHFSYASAPFLIFICAISHFHLRHFSYEAEESLEMAQMNMRNGADEYEKWRR